MELAAEGPDRTRVTVRWEPQEANAADIAEFIKQRGSMTMGWTGSFDKLEAVLGGVMWVRQRRAGDAGT